MKFQPPVIGLIYANLNQDLISIEKEILQISSALQTLEENKFVTVEIIADASTKDITNFFQKYSRIHIFHFAGHANGNQIMIEDGGFRDGLKGFFSRQNELALVFLNGCDTAAQAKPFLEAGAKVVIATQFDINDKYAADFAITFYESLAHPDNPKSIKEAFQDATDHLTTKTGWDRSGKKEIIEYRALAFRSEFTDELPWKLFFRTEAKTYLDWKVNRESVLLEKLRQGSRRYFEKLHNGRFQNLFIQDLILPKIKTEHPFFITDVRTENEEHLPLDNLLKDLWRMPEKRHFVLMGEGGSGKTVSLVRFWEKHLNNHSITAPVPIFIPLNEYSGWRIKHDWHDETDNFIVSFIARTYLTGNEAFTLEEKNAFLESLRKPITEGVQGYLPSVILLLDGFNEITADQNDLIIALNWLHKDFPGLQIGLTSRHEMSSFVFTQNSTIALLNPLDLQTITQYLQIQGVADSAMLTPNMDILLQNPMMLTIYTAASEVFIRYKDDQHRFDFKPNMTSKGEILWNFLEAQRAKLFRDDEDRSDAADMEVYKLMLQYFLPMLGNYMILMGKFYFLWKEIEELLNRAVLKLIDPIFSEQYHVTNKAFRLIKRRLELSDGGDNRITIDIVMDFLTRQLKLLVVENEGQEDLDAHEELNTKYVFLHQIFRDFFAARYIQQQIKIATSKEILPEVLKNTPIDFYVRQLLGELEGEHTNRMEWNPINEKWRWSKEQFFLENNLSTTLNLCRDIFDRQELGYIVWNILTMWTEQRGELSGADLSSLNFEGISLNGIRICRPGLSTTFAKSIVPENSFSPKGHSGEVNCALYSPDGRQIITGAADKTVKVWDAETGDCLTTLKGHWGSVLSVCYHPDGLRIISGGSADAIAKVWEVETGKCLLTLEGHTSWVRSVACSPNGQRILTASRDKTAKIWDANTGKCLQTLTGHSGEINCAIYSPNGRLILTASRDETVKVWDTETGNCIWTFTGDFYHLSCGWRSGIYGITNASYSPDGQHIIVSTTKMSKILSAETGECLKTLEGVFCGTYSPDGHRIITGAGYSTARIWDTNTGKYLTSLDGHLNEINSAFYSPDGRRIITASGDHSAKVWDAESGNCLLSLEGYSDRINNAIFSPSGENILVGSNDHSAKVWDIKSMFKIPSIGYKRQILFYTSLDFFAIAAGYVCKICLV